MSKHNNHTSHYQGFSLIELLVVIGIIAVLAGLTTFNFNSARMRARDVQRKNDLRTVQKALETYRNDNSQKFPVPSPTILPGYPTPSPTPVPDGKTWDNLMTSLIAGGYAQKNLKDPKENTAAGSWQNYVYNSTDMLLSYELWACLENASDPEVYTYGAGAKIKCPSSTAGPGYLYKLTQP